MSAQTESERQAAEQWLAAELNRMWLVAERCLRQFQRAQLRPQPDNRRSPRSKASSPLVGRRVVVCRAGQWMKPSCRVRLPMSRSSLYALRRSAPIGRVIENLGLSPLEVETLIVAMSPHIDAPLSDVFSLLRSSPSRRRRRSFAGFTAVSAPAERPAAAAGCARPRAAPFGVADDPDHFARVDGKLIAR